MTRCETECVYPQRVDGSWRVISRCEVCGELPTVDWLIENGHIK